MADERGVGGLGLGKVGRNGLENIRIFCFLAKIELETEIQQLGKPGEFLFQVARILLDHWYHGCEQ